MTPMFVKYIGEAVPSVHGFSAASHIVLGRFNYCYLLILDLVAAFFIYIEKGHCVFNVPVMKLYLKLRLMDIS